MNVGSYLDHLRASADYRGQVVHCMAMPEKPGCFADPKTAIDTRLSRALAGAGIKKFYTHQATAIDAVSPPEPRDVVIVTGTASGKSVCYNVPVLNSILKNQSARALFLYPTKALAQDQLGALDRLCSLGGLGDSITASTFDGDTPQAKRQSARRSAQIVLSNPDMLHANILPQNGRWAREGFFTNLQYVVIDEVHAYRGTFGSHVANVIRRLRRVCRHYGSDPIFICCSATIANPRELAARLIGKRDEDILLIDQDGSPRGRKVFVLWNPPFIDRSNLERRSANVEAQRLMRDLIVEGAQAISFARARVVAELIYKYLREELEGMDPALARKVRPYRGGYLPSERREIEQELFSGRLRGVCSTNALELGIDVGSLDAAVIVGFPGTICSIWQQAGRAGRSREESLAVFVAYSDPIDQYFMRHPEYFFSQSPEHAAIDPLNERILESQLKCAAGELPLAPEDNEVFGFDVLGSASRFSEQPGADAGWQAWPDGRWGFHDVEGRLPHHRVSLRLIGNESFDIIDRTDGRRDSIGNVDSISAPELVYPNAVYLHEGREYLVRSLDWEARIASVERVQVDYYTQAVLSDQCRVVDTLEGREWHGGSVCTGHVNVTWQTVAFKKIKYYTLEVIGQEGLDLPPQTIHTVGFWATFPDSLHRDLAAAGFKPIAAMVGIRNLLLVTLPMMAMCDRRDVSGCVDSSNLGRLAMFVYDRYEGGIGYARLGYEHFAELLTVCRELVRECPCTEGCPSCVGMANVRPPIHSDPDVGSGYSIPDKAATVFALERWLSNESDRSGV